MAKDHRPLHLSEKPFSLLQANELFVNKILARNSSFGRSARLPACRLPGRIPFDWEAQPGLPKDQPPEILPPPDLPSSTASGLSKKTPHVIPKQEPVKLWFWKKPKRKLSVVVKKNGAFGSSSSRRNVDDESSSCVSYSMSPSSSSASSSNERRRRSKLSRLAKGFIRWAF